MATETVNLNNELKKYGVPEADVKSLRTPSPELLDYLDLLITSDEQPLMPNCVVESQDRPLLFVVNESLFPQTPPEADYHRLCHTLACRGKRSYLACIRPGELHVFPVESTSIPVAKVYQAGSEEALSFFPRLAMGYYDGQETTSRGDFVLDKMLKLLNEAAEALVSCNIEHSDVLSLVGRVLFFRFLCDRKIINEQDVQTIAPDAAELQHCFNGAKKCVTYLQMARQNFQWRFSTSELGN